MVTTVGRWGYMTLASTVQITPLKLASRTSATGPLLRPPDLADGSSSEVEDISWLESDCMVGSALARQGISDSLVILERRVPHLAVRDQKSEGPLSLLVGQELGTCINSMEDEHYAYNQWR